MTVAARNRLVEQHIGLVKNIAVALARRLPPWVELDDLMQEGYLALISCAARYRKGPVIFGKFAMLRVRGAMLDSIRRRHWTNGSHYLLDPEANWMEQRLSAPHLDGEARIGSVRTTALESQLLDPNNDFEADLAAAEAAAAVREAVAELPHDERCLLTLRYAKDHTLVDASAAMGVSNYRGAKLERAGLARLRTRRLAGVA